MAVFHSALKELTKIIMWSRLSADFDTTISTEACLKNCTLPPLKAGEIIVFHDSIKAFDKLKIVLPLFIEHALSAGFSFETL
jgi:peptidoglycan-N-acetylglucosamine deacetylase